MSNTLDGTSRVFVELTEAQIKEREEEIERMVRDIAEGFVEEDGDAKDLAIEEFMDAFAVFGNDYAEHRIAQREAQPPAPVSPPAVTDAEWYPHGFAAQLERAPSLLSPPGSQVVLDRATVDSLAHWLRTLPKTVSTRSGLAPKGGGE
jgi:hypothetical protein